MSDDAGSEKRFHGVGVSPGIARGTVFVYRTDDDEEPPVRRIPESEIPAEIARFESALILTRAQILEMQERIAEAIGAKDAGIFDAHLLVVEDRTLIDEVLRTLTRDHNNIEHVFQQVANRYSKTLSEIDDPYLRERALDIHDVARRVLAQPDGQADPAAFLDRDSARPGGAQSHAFGHRPAQPRNSCSALPPMSAAGPRTRPSWPARWASRPWWGLHNVSEVLESGQHVLLDGYNGLLILNPNDQTLWEYGELEIKKTQVEEKLTQLRETTSRTIDGRHVVLSANIELPEEVAAVKKNGAEGIGLYRTEFFYINKTELPDEEEQYVNYKRVADEVLPHSVIIRTLDLGGDKFMSALDLPEEMNPFLGWRAIRFCLERPEIFKVQLRAILRASVGGNVRMMYPMISGVEELRRANAVLEECKAELRAEKHPVRRGDGSGRDDRDPERGRHRRSAGPRGRFLLDRHQRPDPVLDCRRSRERAHRPPLRAHPSRHHPPDQERDRCRPCARPLGRRLRGNGGGDRPDPAADRSGSG